MALITALIYNVPTALMNNTPVLALAPHMVGTRGQDTSAPPAIAALPTVLLTCSVPEVYSYIIYQCHVWYQYESARLLVFG